MTQFAPAVVVSLLPVLAFLGALVALDSYKLVRPRRVAAVLAMGGGIAVVVLAVHLTLIRGLDVSPRLLIRWIAPPVEEVVKASVVAALIRRNRVGFLVDAAILGFATGAGFAVIENVYYLSTIPGERLGVWLIRGFGTAVMHGGTTTLFALVTKTLVDRRGEARWRLFLPGLVPAIAVHAAFNHFWVRPIVATIAVLVALPPLVAIVFRESERSLRRWLGVGFDADARLLGSITSGDFPDTAAGAYLGTVRDRFPPEVLVDMLCYLRLHTELALRAKGELMMREHGFASAIEPDVVAKFDEMRFLERSIGPTGRLALLPILHGSSRDLWQLYVLGKA